MLKRAQNRVQFRIHLVDVIPGGGKEGSDFLLGHLHGFDLFEDDLHLTVVKLRMTGYPDEPGRGQIAHLLFIEGPLPGRGFPAGIADQTFEIGLAGPGGADLGIQETVNPFQMRIGFDITDIGVG